MKILVLHVLKIVFRLRIFGFLWLRNSRFNWFGNFVLSVLFVRACLHACGCGCDFVSGHISVCVRVYIYVEG